MTAAQRALAATWRFGVGQTTREERAEIERARLMGLTDHYLEAQDVAQLVRDHGVSVETAVEVVREARGETSPTPEPEAVVRSEPSPPPPTTERGNDGYLVDHARGTLPAAPVPVPEDIPPWTRPVAEFVALVIGLRLTVGDRRPSPFASEWTARHVGCSTMTAHRALKALAAHGFLVPDDPLPARGPGRKGTATYGTSGFTVPGTARLHSDDVPDAAVEGGAVAVEAQGVGAAGAAVEPPGEPPDERAVGGAVGDGALGMSHGSLAAVGGAGSVGHDAGRYAGRPTTDRLVAKYAGEAATGARTEPKAAFMLARQLQAKGYSAEEAVEPLLDLAGQVSASFTSADAMRALKGAYWHEPLEPWGARS